MFDHRYLDEGVEEVRWWTTLFCFRSIIFQINQFKNDLKSHSSSLESSSDENPEGDMLSGGYG